MKRRNFLSGVLAAPLALKARFLALFQKRPVEPCGAPLLEEPARRLVQPQSWRGIPLGTKTIPELAKCCPTNVYAAIRQQPKSLTARQRQVVQLLAEGKSMKEAAGVPEAAAAQGTPANTGPTHFFCSLPKGHKGPHMLVNRQVHLTRLSFGPKISA